MVSAWCYLIVAALFEASWAIGLEYSEGFTKLRPSIATVVSMAISVILLAKATRSLPIGTAYAVWTGIGTSLTVTLGVVLFDETASVVRVGCIGLIVIGVVGLEFTGQ